MRAYEDCETFTGDLGDQSYLNTSDDYVLLRNITLEELHDHASNFKLVLYEWSMEQLCYVIDESNTCGESTIEAFKAYNRSPTAYGNSPVMKVIDIDLIDSMAWKAVGHEIPAARSLQQHIVRLSSSDEIALLKAAVPDIETLHEMILPRRETEFVYDALWLELRKAPSAIAFLDALCDRCNRGTDIDYYRSMVVRGSKQVKFSTIPDAFVFYLADRGVLLRPFNKRPFQTFARNLDVYVLTADTRDLYEKMLNSFSVKFKRPSIENKRRRHSDSEPIWLTRFRLSFFTVLFCTTMRTDRQLTTQLLSRYLAAIEGTIPSYIIQFHRFFYEETRARSAQRDDIPALDRTRGTPLTSRLDWVRLTYTSQTCKSFPSPILIGYTPRDNIVEWADFFNSRIPHLTVKSISNVVSTINTFLLWLVVTNNRSRVIADLERSTINDGLPLATSQCYRAFLKKRDMTEQSVNQHLGRLAGLFQTVIHEKQIEARNPIMIRLDTLRPAVRRGRTPRVALGAEMLRYIRAFNAKDEFGFSKSRPAHQRYVVGDDGITFSYRWYPGVAILLDFLLRIPIRGFQARYLDSGEGDERLPDLDSPDLAMRPNPAPSATKHRKEFVLTSIDGLSGSNLLGLYINTNKTAVDRVSGYEIPWCDDELKKNILFMRDWQQKYNPLTKPIYCVEKGRTPLNQEVVAMLKESYPLFRDPIEDGYPMSRDVIYRYWDDLLRAVELQIAAEDPTRPPVQLTEETIFQKGHGKTERRHVSRYDIHTLRVSGITALIDAGLPPNMVADVAGHSTIVMTLYYNKTAASTLNARLAAAIEATTATLNDFGHLSGEDFESVTEYLINHRDAEDQRGLEMLRERCGIGDGSIVVMPHGICPGGECSTGGEWTNQAVEHMPVPRPLACSLCRYRLTGPMFLSGLVANTNKLLFEMRRCGEEIGALNDEAQKMSAAGKPVHQLKAQIASLDRQTDIICEEWAAEYGYARRAELMLADYLARPGPAQPGTGDQLPVLSALDAKDVEVRLDRKSGFALLQQLSESVQSCPGFRPEQPLQDHREFLNEVLCANNIEPFLLRLTGPMRDVAANLLGRAISAAVPDDRIVELKHPKRFDDYPIIQETIDRIEAIVAEANRSGRQQVEDMLALVVREEAISA